MRILFIVLTSMLMSSVVLPISAEPWEMSLDANLMMTLNTYSDNWTGDELGSFSWTFGSNFLAQKQFSTKIHNKNNLKLSFGQTRNQNEEDKSWSNFVKSTDLIDFETVFRFTLGGFVDPFTAGRIETQFIDQSDPDKDQYLNPATFTESFGIAKVLMSSEKRELTARLGAGFKQYLDRDVLVDTLTSERETEFTNYGGLEFVTDFNTPLAKEQLTYTTKLTIFQAFIYSEASALQGLPNENYWKYPDLNWENIFTANITKYLMVNLYLQLLYDKEIDPGTRFKQILSLGLTYKIG